MSHVIHPYHHTKHSIVTKYRIVSTCDLNNLNKKNNSKILDLIADTALVSSEVVCNKNESQNLET
jgi:hypothetical protein